MFVSHISPYIREGSGLKRAMTNKLTTRLSISPYIREGSGLKHMPSLMTAISVAYLPLHP